MAQESVLRALTVKLIRNDKQRIKKEREGKSCVSFYESR